MLIAYEYYYGINILILSRYFHGVAMPAQTYQIQSETIDRVFRLKIYHISDGLVAISHFVVSIPPLEMIEELTEEIFASLCDCERPEAVFDHVLGVNGVRAWLEAFFRDKITDYPKILKELSLDYAAQAIKDFETSLVTKPNHAR